MVQFDRERTFVDKLEPLAGRLRDVEAQGQCEVRRQGCYLDHSVDEGQRRLLREKQETRRRRESETEVQASEQIAQWAVRAFWRIEEDLYPTAPEIWCTIPYEQSGHEKMGQPENVHILVHTLSTWRSQHMIWCFYKRTIEISSIPNTELKGQGQDLKISIK
ncbi:hypothetical protein PsorP6_015996 [Peronosclerospora sorghi]|uniref:Uncharacterized protein n=1 Tax=Peronosclerospora sorghi TaxID=230839 RepID=A0ACC0WQK0_9STRA|nr:hypothetical protein PsorP6_015996 [Peronosclerospora sorghi]